MQSTATAEPLTTHSGAKRTGLLRYAADRRTIGFVTTYFGLVAFGLTTDLPWWGSVLLSITICLMAFFCAVISHNVIHSPTFRSRGLNRALQIVISLTYGHPVSMFVPGHNLSHHKYLQTAKDRMRTDKMRFRWNILNQVVFGWAVGAVIFKDNWEYAKIMKVKRPAWFRQLMIETGAFVAFLVVTLSLSLWPHFAPWKFLLFVIIPHQYAVWGITGINFIQHEGCDAEHEYNHSRNFTGKLVNWFTFNNGFHGIHHMHPGLHWSLAPAVHAKELAPFIDPRLDQKSLLAYCFKAYVFPGKRLNFDGTPVVLPPPRPDEPWVQSAVAGLDDPRTAGDYGAVT